MDDEGRQLLVKNQDEVTIKVQKEVAEKFNQILCENGISPSQMLEQLFQLHWRKQDQIQPKNSAEKNCQLDKRDDTSILKEQAVIDSWNSAAGNTSHNASPLSNTTHNASALSNATHNASALSNATHNALVLSLHNTFDTSAHVPQDMANKNFSSDRENCGSSFDLVSDVSLCEVKRSDDSPESTQEKGHTAKSYDKMNNSLYTNSKELSCDTSCDSVSMEMSSDTSNLGKISGRKRQACLMDTDCYEIPNKILRGNTEISSSAQPDQQTQYTCSDHDECHVINGCHSDQCNATEKYQDSKTIEEDYQRNCNADCDVKNSSVTDSKQNDMSCQSEVTWNVQQRDNPKLNNQCNLGETEDYHQENPPNSVEGFKDVPEVLRDCSERLMEDNLQQSESMIEFENGATIHDQNYSKDLHYNGELANETSSLESYKTCRLNLPKQFNKQILYKTKKKTYQCPVCKFHSDRVLCMVSHLQNGHRHQRKCNLCDKMFYSKFLLRCHQVIKHDDVSSFVCAYCGDIYRALRDYRTHLQVVHQNEHLYVYDCFSKGREIDRRSSSFEQDTVYDNGGYDEIEHVKSMDGTYAEEVGSEAVKVCKRTEVNVSDSTLAPEKFAPETDEQKNEIEMIIKSENNLTYISDIAQMQNRISHVHTKPQIDEEPIASTCRTCLLQFDSRKSLLNHRNKHRNNVNLHAVTNCHLCGKVVGKKLLSWHLRMCIVTMFRGHENRSGTACCKICSLLFASKWQLRDHLVMVHMHTKEHICRCGHEFHWKSLFLHHTRKCHFASHGVCKVKQYLKENVCSSKKMYPCNETSDSIDIEYTKQSPISGCRNTEDIVLITEKSQNAVESDRHKKGEDFANIALSADYSFVFEDGNNMFIRTLNSKSDEKSTVNASTDVTTNEEKPLVHEEVFKSQSIAKVDTVNDKHQNLFSMNGNPHVIEQNQNADEISRTMSYVCHEAKSSEDFTIENSDVDLTENTRGRDGAAYKIRDTPADVTKVKQEPIDMEYECLSKLTAANIPASNQFHQPVSSNHLHQQVLSNQCHQPVLSNQLHQPVMSNQLHQPVSSNQLHQPVMSNQLHQPVMSNQLHQPVPSNQPNLRVSSDQRHQPVSYAANSSTAVVDLSNEQNSKGKPSLHYSGTVSKRGALGISSQKTPSDKTSNAHIFRIKMVGNMFQCPNCFTSYKSQMELAEHFFSKCQKQNIKVKAENKASHVCKLCNLNFATIDQYRTHCWTKHIEKDSNFIPCKICGQSFMSESYLREHMQGKHNAIGRYSCTCGKKFKWRSSFCGHKKKCNGTISLTRQCPRNRLKGRIPQRHGLSELSPLENIRTENVAAINKYLKQRKHYPITEGIDKQNVIKSSGVNSQQNSSRQLSQQQEVTSPDWSMMEQNRQLDQNLHADKEWRRSLPSIRNIMGSSKAKRFVESLKEKSEIHQRNRLSTGNKILHHENNLDFPLQMKQEDYLPTKSSNTTESIAKPQVSVKWPNISAATQANMIYKQAADKGGSMVLKNCENNTASIEIKTEPPELEASSNIATQIKTENLSSRVAPFTGSSNQSVFPVGRVIRNLTPYGHTMNALNIPHMDFQQKACAQDNKLSVPGINISQVSSAPLNASSVNVSSLHPTNIFTSEGTRHNQPISRLLQPINLKGNEVSNANITSHIVPVTPIRSRLRFQCTICSGLFSSKWSQVKHSATCTGGKVEGLMNCSICGTHLRGKANLREHMLGKHGDPNRYSCPCGMKFKWRSSLGSHQKSCSESIKSTKRSYRPYSLQPGNV